MTFRSTLLTTAAAIALTSAAHAQTATTAETDPLLLKDGEAAAVEAGNAVEGAVQGAAETMENAGDAIASGAEATGDAIVDGAQTAGDVIADGAEATGDAIENGAQELAVEADDATELDADAPMTAETRVVPLDGAETDASEDALIATDAANDAMTDDAVVETDAAEVEVTTTETEVIVADADADASGLYGTFGDFAVSDLVGQNVLVRQDGGSEFDDIGEIDNLVRASAGSGEVLAIVGVGGFLGLGEHDVAIPLNRFEQLDDALVLPDMTEAELDAMPEFDGEAEILANDMTVSGEPIVVE
ncbi:PRC-barrel domain-containing protein [Jannaschia sp. LMIT008]|uniref:PRC-barrel domain-containing protein n=1 Tax=Jannaschia maritima TaxID=3032585 RepID=UPI002812256D|nr:PRC-barrel domain-containing protein [Jannaschia sp. LMIT008]